MNRILIWCIQQYNCWKFFNKNQKKKITKRKKPHQRYKNTNQNLQLRIAENAQNERTRGSEKKRSTWSPTFKKQHSWSVSFSSSPSLIYSESWIAINDVTFHFFVCFQAILSCIDFGYLSSLLKKPKSRSVARQWRQHDHQFNACNQRRQQFFILVSFYVVVVVLWQCSGSKYWWKYHAQAHLK